HEIRIEGYTDTDPIRKSKWASNEHLSFERANAVEKYLISRGVDTKRMYAAAFGPDRPKGSKQDSRRVEIVVLGR
ncbi:MAG: OmpA family protein, partial [Phycisphaerales bacterium]|nr:OmpA family protein [Phycisphaerales bacterium]